MKKILIILSLVILQGCTLLDAYLMTNYDPNEYQLITYIRAEARQFKTQCDNVNSSKFNAGKIAHDTQLFVLYSEHIPRNENLIEAGKALNVIAQGLLTQYQNDKVSPAFCKIKFENIETSADKLQKVIGGRPR
jgi:hypothetical protein